MPGEVKGRVWRAFFDARFARLRDIGRDRDREVGRLRGGELSFRPLLPRFPLPTP